MSLLITEHSQLSAIIYIHTHAYTYNPGFEVIDYDEYQAQ